MEQIREKLNKLRAEADAAVDRAEASESKNKKYEQELLQKDQEIQSLTHRLSLSEAEVEKLEGHVSSAKKEREVGEVGRSTNENLQRKVQLLEEELDSAEKNARETVEKLRQVDVKAEHFERQVMSIQHEATKWEQKYEEMRVKFQKTQDELDTLSRDLEGV